MAGTVTDPWPLLCSADVVVAAAGDAAIADVAAARAPLVAVPQDRPFREQVEHVRVLAGRQLCIAATPWPTRKKWPRLLASAQKLAGHRWAEVSDGLGAQRAAALLSELASSPVREVTLA
jgi:UDP-N-acetylglucosamine:LPS N-acetylglucosamine transferase